MTWEVELKFPLAINGGDRHLTTVLSRLAELGAEEGMPQAQKDVYFAHPARDFAVTDEALRIRSCNNVHSITYKGPLVDAQTKTRREIEVAIGQGMAAATFTELLNCLGFRPVRQVVKTRVPYRLPWERRDVEVALDDVDGLGTFLEIETLADDSDREAARDSILRLAGTLGLEHSERRSYLCLLLQSDE